MTKKKNFPKSHIKMIFKLFLKYPWNPEAGFIIFGVSIVQITVFIEKNPYFSESSATYLF